MKQYEKTKYDKENPLGLKRSYKKKKTRNNSNLKMFYFILT